MKSEKKQRIHIELVVVVVVVVVIRLTSIIISQERLSLKCETNIPLEGVRRGL